ncbi:hypothetical protein HJB90_08915 [Rhizobium sp. NLR10a]|uniref:hypothetical protein n=1 Tax=unclassified Rhizobium TaxID=2613769 RepID=UPI001C834C0F|nr:MULTISPECIES: hypothetical protein [unclassified Rhizobium]MBX5213965.1 hypothetical protein [Rhizobium sp. NLR9a]MBX5218886.1 hypothetical protein [Rhizobium sp. NLR8a]MBX5275354.1 hypothetical protein [Rhizobium sp. NLR13a]MBX5281141.1 hypothetical protein [Rhizobium sp. NLR10a]MBX5297537.1 hypothetical protein [Rhizobium sp. NLR15a]
MKLDIAPIFRPYLDEAIARFSYLHPEVAVIATGGGVEVNSSDLDLIAAFRHTLYRQKIHGETDLLRRAVIERLLR